MGYKFRLSTFGILCLIFGKVVLYLWLSIQVMSNFMMDLIVLAILVCFWSNSAASEAIQKPIQFHEIQNVGIQDRTTVEGNNDCQYCCTGGSCSGCPGFDDSACSSFSCINDGVCNKCCTKLSKVSGCATDLWSRYVTKQPSNTIDTYDKWEDLYSAEDLSSLEAAIHVGNPYTIVYNVTNECSRSDVVIGFAGTVPGGFLKAVVPPCPYAYCRHCPNSKCPYALMVSRGNWIGNGNSPTRLENVSECSRRRAGSILKHAAERPMKIHNIYLFEGIIDVTSINAFC